jgi:hypothetical protein
MIAVSCQTVDRSVEVSRCIGVLPESTDFLPPSVLAACHSLGTLPAHQLAPEKASKWPHAKSTAEQQDLPIRKLLKACVLGQMHLSKPSEEDLCHAALDVFPH